MTTGDGLAVAGTHFWPEMLVVVPGFLIECLGVILHVVGWRARRQGRGNVSSMPFVGPLFNFIGFNVGLLLRYRFSSLAALFGIGLVLDIMVHPIAWLNLCRALVSKKFWSAIFPNR